MPAGIIATVDNGFATLDFVDKSLRGPALAELVEIGGPASIETITRDGPRRKYRVPAGNAQAAGLLDGDEVGDVWSAGRDTGAAAATKASDPNVNAGADNANWHTPVDQHTSANAYVGKVPNATVLHNRGQVYTGDAGSAGGDLAHPPTHAEVIQNVKDAKTPPTEGFMVQSARASVVAGSLAEQDAALGSDPGGWAPQPGEGDTGTEAAPEADVSAPSEPQGSETPTAEVTTPAEAPAYPDGEPTVDWTRKQLDAYAADKLELDTTKLESKAAVLAAINAPKE
ncbi:hypothetical protein BANE1_15 [Mycobacterium phage Bane1]|uniref:Uncharacterized protein n=3 Tax=Coopervirus TaxID=1982898 RepID=G1BL70_9CAUD|nr:hypothetical protein BANE1_15 [Mycobacterium phage Bane1]YP_009614336.1 hypothetical protein FDI63_gp013 [Mycobacterium phage ChrisnMich]AEJ94582.1 hypothetical protein CHRISNMICH_13 [Mycobacterium phage ChrisnMich]AGU92034.1 hypothetical protein BANE1_15 [Mycobacterium phage Bane1]AGU92131.1 hypothetical protein BANE2_15 [Mycobacterium phage Bane2]